MKGNKETLFYTCVSVGMALATSVFTMIAGLFEIASALWIVVGIILAGVFCSAVALSIGELASMFPSAPGLRTYFKVAFGDFTSLIFVYLYLGFAVIVAGLESVVISHVVNAVFPQVSPTLLILSLAALVVFINVVGFQTPRTIQVATAIGAVVLVLGAGLDGMVRPDASVPVSAELPATQGLLVLPALVGMAIFLFAGFEWVTPLGLRPSAYKWKIPASMLIGIATLAIAYAVFVLGISSRLSAQEVAGQMTPQMGYFVSLYGAPGAYLGLLLSFLAIFSTFNAGILGGSQLIYLLGREGNLPAWCATMSVSTGCPSGAILALGGIATLSGLVVLRWQLTIVAAVVGAIIVCTVYAGFLLAAIRLRTTRADMARPFPSPLPNWLQYALAAALLVIGVQVLLSEPDRMLASCLGLLLAVAVAVMLAVWSQMRRARDVQPIAPLAAGGRWRMISRWSGRERS
jgi:amino acid transporter